MYDPLSSVPSAPARPGWLLWALIGVAVLALVGAICCGLTVFGGFRLFQGIQAEQAAIIPVVRAFLDAGEREDVGAALGLFADEAATPSARADLERLFADRPELFAGVADVRITSLNLSANTSGTTAQVSGDVIYAGDQPRRTFSATLRREGEVWQLLTIEFAEGVGGS